MRLDKIISRPVWMRGAPVSRIYCGDGQSVSISVQASESAYCTPRDNLGPWTEVECGYPSVTPPDPMMEYAEDPDRPTDTVYAWVPIRVVREFIETHGGEADNPEPEAQLNEAISDLMYSIKDWLAETDRLASGSDWVKVGDSFAAEYTRIMLTRFGGFAGWRGYRLRDQEELEGDPG